MSATQDNKQGVSQKEVALVIGGTIGGSVVAGLLSVGLFYWHNYNEQKKLREETRRMCQNKFATHKLYILYNMLRLETIKFGLGELQSIYTTFRKRLENPNHGVLTFSDFGALLDEIKGEGKYDRRLALLVFSIWDLDRSGSVDFLELVEGLSVLCHGSQISILSRYFTAFDEDGNGQLNREEVSNLIRAMNPFVTDPKVHQELVTKIFAALDMKGRNLISRKEWSHLAFDPNLNFEWTWEFNNQLCARFDLIYSKYHPQKNMADMIHLRDSQSTQDQ